MLNPEDGASVALKWMLDDLLEWGLEVVLKPAPDPKHRGHMVRAVSSMNPIWYQELCAAHPGRSHRRRPRSATLVKRRHIIRVLRRMVRGERGFSSWEEPLLTIADDYYRRFCESDS